MDCRFLFYNIFMINARKNYDILQKKENNWISIGFIWDSYGIGLNFYVS